MTIRKLIQLGAFALLLLLAVGGTIAAIEIREISIGGPIETRQRQTAELMADVLPPANYIIEPFMSVTLALEDSEHSAQIINNLVRMEKAYRTRKDVWLNADLPPGAADNMRQAYEWGDKFWASVDNQFIPAIRRGDRATADHYHDTVITPAFDRHREAIDNAIAEISVYQADLEEKAQGSLKQIDMILGVAALLVVTCVGLFCWSMLSRVSAPLARTAETMRAMVNGDLSAAIEGDTRADEIGDVARALVSFRQAEVDKRALEEMGRAQQAERTRIIDALSVALRHLANGDVSYRIEDQFEGQYEELRQDFNSALTAMGSALRAVSEASHAIRLGTGEIAQASNDLSIRTEQQAAALEETSASMTTATGSVRETADAAKEANSAVQDAHDAAEQGGRIVHEAIAAMDEIENSSKQISQIIALIDNVAFQTNLLALNAAVEAARAGDAGDGFAVVAAEVRGLAQRTADAANDVKKLITSSAQQVENGVRLVGQAGETLDHIVERVSEITKLVRNIAGSVEEESLVLVQVNAAVGEMDQMTQQNAAMVEESTASARNLASEAESLAKLVGNFQIDMPNNDLPITSRTYRSAGSLADAA
ncbi:methyl-accepting chemotaxis protein [Sphingobium sp. DEHP117]|uniref:methyl-accepting chemotaxis protein n=1 Tax=Sphingobium sp. DEHP117 TaxID=2993436 RepID=UPI0027D66294|nr:methyl-accepting chemotaxis protein [Sphingobium sp. DEHP117]MDQ4420281.1 methyl-accepting chemotaxis protein [Sphingobium sp. DEHP117]